MKLKNIFLAGLGIAMMSSCNDYLDVDSPSKYTTDYVFSTTTEANRALNGVYAQLLSNNAWGNAYVNTLVLNSDVDFAANSGQYGGTNNPKRFDVTSDGGTMKSVWEAAYQGVEYANNFIYNLEKSEAYINADIEDKMDYNQMLGEAKVIRAMFYNELCWYFGDIPFTLTPTYAGNSFTLPIINRDEVRTTLINDLKEAAKVMKSSKEVSNGAERISKEACWAMIARLALSAGGYSLRPDGDTWGKMERPSNYAEFYQTARDYADSVIVSTSYSLSKSFQDVFVDECNFTVSNGDDVIFEIPFAKEANGNIGYYQGPSVSFNSGGVQTDHNWGSSNGGVRCEAFYRFSFDESDSRRDYINGLWYYDGLSVPTIRSDYSVHNNKWSKLWNTNGMGPEKSGSTGINYPYLRYTDVLLMFAEADNEVKGAPSPEAKEALKAVRDRAFRGASDYDEKVNGYVDALNSKEDFLKAVLNERKWEFAGENMRWKDLVRNNIYNVELYWTFLRYWMAAEEAGGTCDFAEFVEKHDGVAEGKYTKDLPRVTYYKVVANPKDVNIYPNTTLDILDIYNRHNGQELGEDGNMHSVTKPGSDWSQKDFFAWWNDNGYPTNQVLYSLFGFIRGDESGNMYFIDNGAQKPVQINGTATPAGIPVVRYILPYPQDICTRAGYKNQYGY